MRLLARFTGAVAWLRWACEREADQLTARQLATARLDFLGWKCNEWRVAMVPPATLMVRDLSVLTTTLCARYEIRPIAGRLTLALLEAVDGAPPVRRALASRLRRFSPSRFTHWSETVEILRLYLRRAARHAAEPGLGQLIRKGLAHAPRWA